MAIIKPFKALRPAVEKAKQVSSVPYDVIHESEVRDFVAGNPISFLRVTRADVESALTDRENVARAKLNLRNFVEDAILVPDPVPSFYIYRLTADTHSQTGLVACCSLDEYESGVIKKHEKTRPDKVTDRTRHMLELRAQTGLIFLAYRRTERIDDLIARSVQRGPIYDFLCDTGVRQTVWQLPETREMAAAFADVPALYIADGHHRMESALLARNELRAQNAGHDGNEDYNYVMAALFPAEQLRILAYNRVISGLDELSDEDILARIRNNFIVTETEKRVPETHGEICMYLGGKWFDLQFAVDNIREPDPVERLDVSILQHYVLEPVLGVADPRTDKRIGFVGGIRGTDELERLVDSGEARIAFSLFPTTMDDLLAISDVGEIMPPKSTWFEPKLKDGLFVHRI